MKSGKLVEIMEKHTGAMFINSPLSDYRQMIPAVMEPHLELDHDEIAHFWTMLFAREAHFDRQTGELTEESRQNILSHLEAIQVAARSISLELLYGMPIIAAHILENADVTR
jgi:hypothetical protein